MSSRKLLSRARNFHDRRAIPVVSFLLVCLYVGLRLWRLGFFDLWTDEVFSVEVARQSWRTILTFAAADIVHPPLFYVLLKLWRAAGGESVWWLQLLPALTSTLALAPFFLLCRALHLRHAIVNTALFLMAVNSFLVFYAQELRGYSLAFLLSLCSMWLFVRFAGDGDNASNAGEAKDSCATTNERLIIDDSLHEHTTRRAKDFTSSAVSSGNVGWLFAANLLLIYTHYFGWLLVACEMLCLLWWRRGSVKVVKDGLRDGRSAVRRSQIFRFVLSIVALVICFAPWAYLVAQAMSVKHGLAGNLGWIPRPRAVDFFKFYGLLHGTLDRGETVVVSHALFVIALAAACVAVFRRCNSRSVKDRSTRATFSLLLVFAFVPTSMALVASHVLPQSVWGERHLIISVVPYLLLIAFGVFRLRPAPLRCAFLAVLCIWATFAGNYSIRRTDRKIQWSAVVRNIAEREAQTPVPVEAQSIAPVKVYTVDNWVTVPLRFALERSTAKSLMEIIETKDAGMLPGEHFHIVYLAHNPQEDRLSLDRLRARGCRIEQAPTVKDWGTSVITLSVTCPR